jgi:hypothetical protein
VDETKQAALSWERPEVNLGVVCCLAYGLLRPILAMRDLAALALGSTGACI